MNDWYSVDPTVFDTSKELKFFLESFGHHTGRYMLTLPVAWQQLVRKHLTDTRPIESQRILETLRIGKSRGALWSHPKAPDQFEREKWIETAAKLFKTDPKLIRTFIASQSELESFTQPRDMPVTSYEDFDVSSDTSEEIVATPDNYVRVAQTLLMASQEIVFVDPYLDISNPRVATVFSALLARLSRGASEKNVVLWIREKEVGSKKRYEENLKEVGHKFWGANLSIKVNAVEDSRAKDRIHARYLLSSKGAIQFDQGFIELGLNKTVPAVPVSLSRHRDLMKKYVSAENDLKVIWTLRLG